MKPKTKRAKKQVSSLCENDGSDENVSNGSGDEWTPDEEAIVDDRSNSTMEDSQNSLHTLDDTDNSELDFSTTAGFSLKIIKNHKMSKHPVWLMFGYLLKDNKLVVRVKDKFFCKKCFDKKKFKR